MMTKPKLIFCVGLPASGKSTYAKKYTETHKNTIWLSSDNIRKELYGDETIQNNPEKIFLLMRVRTKEALMQGINVVWDSTNINYKRRMAFLQELNKIPCEKICILMATPYEECLKNNANRERKVPEEVIERMYRHFDVPWYYEGWDNIEVVYAENSVNYYGTPYDFINLHSYYNQDNSHHKLTLGKHCEKAWYYVTDNQKDNEEYNFHLRVATMLHDCGKPFCKTFTNGKGETTEQAHYYDHQYIGAYDSFFWITDYCNSLYIAVLIRWHMQPYFWEKDNNAKSHNKYRKLWGKELYKDIMLLHEADKNAH